MSRIILELKWGGASRKEINPISFQFIEAILDAFDAIRGEFYAA